MEKEAKKQHKTPTSEEGFHIQAVCQFDRRVPRVGGQSRVCSVVQKQPDNG